MKVAAQCALDAAGVAAARLGTAEVDQGLTAAEVLADPRTRQVTAALARLTTSLRRLVSSSTTPARPSSSALQLTPAEARPVLGPSGPGPTPASWWSSFGWLARCRWRTGLAVLLVLLFPKVVALVLALLVKLCVRAVVALLTHVCKELFFQVMSAASDIEDGLVAYLSQQLGMHPAPPPPFLTNGPVPPQQATAPVAPQTLPARPFDLITVVLLVWNLRRGLPAGGGGGEPQG